MERMMTMLDIDLGAAQEICKRCSKHKHDCTIKIAQGITQLVRQGKSYEEAAEVVFGMSEGKKRWGRDDERYALNGDVR